MSSCYSSFKETCKKGSRAWSNEVVHDDLSSPVLSGIENQSTTPIEEKPTDP
jgi:hypothetical protein